MKEIRSKKHNITIEVDEVLAKKMVESGLYEYVTVEDIIDGFTAKQWEDFAKAANNTDTREPISTCDWCGGTPVAYKDEAYELCENCEDQLFGD